MRVTELQGIDDARKEQKDIEMKEKALALYKPPSSFECGYIFDANNQMVADEADADSMINALRIRGWGRIGYMENPEALQDKVGELIAEALTQYWEGKSAEAPLLERIAELERQLNAYDSEPFAWAVFDGEGNEDLMLYENNETVREDFEKANPKLKGWVTPLYRKASILAAGGEII